MSSFKDNEFSFTVLISTKAKTTTFSVQETKVIDCFKQKPLASSLNPIGAESIFQEAGLLTHPGNIPPMVQSTRFLDLLCLHVLFFQDDVYIAPCRMECPPVYLHDNCITMNLCWK